jgi:FkbM family methyltransferase
MAARYRNWQPLVDFTAPLELPIIGGLGLIAPRGEARLLSQWSDLRQTLSVLELAAKQGDTIVDVGASVGVFAVAAARVVGDRGKVIAFEPAPGPLEALEYNLQRHGKSCRLEVYGIAVGASPGRADFHLYSGNSLIGGLQESPSSRTRGSLIEVPVGTLDEVVRESVSILKVDVEGGELKVLDGAVHALRRSPNAILIVELNLAALHASGGASVLIERLSQYGDLWVLDESGQSPLRGASAPLRCIRSWIEQAISERIPWYANLLVMRGGARQELEQYLRQPVPGR